LIGLLRAFPLCIVPKQDSRIVADPLGKPPSGDMSTPAPPQALRLDQPADGAPVEKAAPASRSPRRNRQQLPEG